MFGRLNFALSGAGFGKLTPAEKAAARQAEAAYHAATEPRVMAILRRDYGDTLARVERLAPGRPAAVVHDIVASTYFYREIMGHSDMGYGGDPAAMAHAADAIFRMDLIDASRGRRVGGPWAGLAGFGAAAGVVYYVGVSRRYTRHPVGVDPRDQPWRSFPTVYDWFKQPDEATLRKHVGGPHTTALVIETAEPGAAQYEDLTTAELVARLNGRITTGIGPSLRGLGGAPEEHAAGVARIVAAVPTAVASAKEWLKWRRSDLGEGTGHLTTLATLRTRLDADRRYAPDARAEALDQELRHTINAIRAAIDPSGWGAQYRSFGQ